MAPFEAYHLLGGLRGAVSWSPVNIVKTAVNSSLVLLSLIDLCYFAGPASKEEATVERAYVTSAAVFTATYVSCQGRSPPDHTRPQPFPLPHLTGAGPGLHPAGQAQGGPILGSNLHLLVPAAHQPDRHLLPRDPDQQRWGPFRH